MNCRNRFVGSQVFECLTQLKPILGQATAAPLTLKLFSRQLGGLAEFERELIKIRTSEGRERAKRAGVKMGRKPILSAHQIAEIRSRKANGESVRFLARSYRVSPNTISRVR